MAKRLNQQPSPTPPPPPPQPTPSAQLPSPKRRATKDPFAVYKAEIIQTFVKNDIAEVLGAYRDGIPSAKELTAAYNKFSSNNISVAMMKSWLKALGFRLEVRPVLINTNIQPAAAPVNIGTRVPEKPLPDNLEDEEDDDVGGILEEDKEVSFEDDDVVSDESDRGGFGKPPRMAPMEPAAPPKNPVNIFRG